MPKPPFTKDEMLGELRRVVSVMANHLAQYGSMEAAELLVGFEPSNESYPYLDADDLARFDLSRFSVTGFMKAAYDYAFQVGQPSHFTDGIAQDIDEFRRGANMWSNDGVGAPMLDPDSKCRIVTDTAFARWNLENGHDLTVRELALLAGMKEAAVRNALSAEGIKVEAGRQQGDPGTVKVNLAYGWLRKRRGFIDSNDPETRAANRLKEYRVLFQERGLVVFKDIMRDAGLSVEDVATKAGVAPVFVEALAAGRPPLDVEAARQVGTALDLDVPSFVGLVVETALRG